MRLEKIKLSGFKSFAEPITIDFANYMTGVVGPNGCGKSNIVDAVRWVMGESSRHIRATTLEEVIFSGTRSRKPMGQASIELIFDNSDSTAGGRFAQYSELSIRRTVARDRESRYFINASRCRRRDIADIFFGTGLGAGSYAVIEQGMVTRIVDARPEEMRLYIEEAAGVAQYRQRRRDTENRIARTRENLDRVMDIAGEVGKQLNKLKRQVKNAEKFKQLRRDKEKFESELLLLRYQRFDDERIACDKKAREMRLDLEKARTQLHAVEADLEEKRILANQGNDEINRMKEEHYQLGARISGEKKDIETREKSVRQLLEEQEEIKAMIGHDHQAMGERRKELAGQEQRCVEIEAETRRLQNEVERLNRENDAARQKLRAIAKDYQEQIDSVSEEITALRDEVHDLLEGLNARQQESSGIQSRLASLEALQEAALRSGEGSGESAFMKWLNAAGLERKDRLIGRIRADSGWERAVETVLGAFVSGFEVPSLENYADHIKGFDEGVLVLFESEGCSHAADGTLADKVSGSRSISSFLARVGLADDLEDALRRRSSLEPHQSLVTRDGTWVGPNWVQLHLLDKGGEGVLSRERRIEKLRSELAQLGAVTDDLKAGLKRQRVRLAEKEAHRDELQARMATILKGITELEGSAGTEESSVQMLEEIRSQLLTTREALHRAEISYGSAKADYLAAQEQLRQLQSHSEELGKRQDSMNRPLGELQASVNESNRELQRLLARHSGEEKMLRQRGQGLTELQGVIQALDRRRAELAREVEAKREAQEQVRTDLQVATARCKDALKEFNKLDAVPEDVRMGMEDDIDVETQEEKLERVQARINRLGAINLVALEEFDELAERKQHLDSQGEDLGRALAMLEEAIREIDSRTRARFKKTFDDINTNLRHIFPKLFGSGEAWLELTDGDVLVAGVSIMVRLPGKRRVSINLLSGGEKALTAVAVVFSIFELNPAPFCLLDEVDAPLDEHNVERFCELLKQMSERVQFIVITHNKISMEYMGSLIGVTMQEPGVSRLVAVDVAEAERLATT